MYFTCHCRMTSWDGDANPGLDRKMEETVFKFSNTLGIKQIGMQLLC